MSHILGSLRNRRGTAYYCIITRVLQSEIQKERSQLDLVSPFSSTPLSFCAPCLWNPCECSHKLHIFGNQNHWPTFCRGQRGSIFIQIFLVGCVIRFFSARVHFGRSRSPKVIDFGINRKRVCDLLLVRHSNLGPILHRFGDTAGF